MSNQNRFLLPHASSCPPATGISAMAGASSNSSTLASSMATLGSTKDGYFDDQENQHSVDTDFDSYWEEEARNPHRNRIRIGRQYQATVPPLMKSGESDLRKLVDLETLTFCPKSSAKVSNSELDFYFTVAKSLNLFASLVETRSLLGRDVTIADLNHIKTKEGLSLASVIQPTRQSANYMHTPQSTSQQTNYNPVLTKSSPSKSPPDNTTNQSTQDNKPSSLSSVQSPSDGGSGSGELVASPQQQLNTEISTINQPLMRALSHFISLHHPCHHDKDCKKLNKEMPLEDESVPTVSITAGNLRQTLSSASCSPAKSRFRSVQNSDTHMAQHEIHDNWTREEVELFSKAIEVCGKNFGSIKKEFLPTKSVRSIVEYYYIGSRDISDTKKKLGQSADSGDGCNTSEKTQTNSFGGSGGGSGDGAGGDFSAGQAPSSSTSLNGKTSSSSSSRQNNDSNTTNYENESRNSSKSISNSAKLGVNPSMPTNQNQKVSLDSKFKLESASVDSNLSRGSSSASKPKTSHSKNIDPRMSVYNFDDEFKDESPIKLECPPRPGAEVKPLKAKPIVPNASTDGETSNSNVGSLKFFMDGQLVLKLNACQDQQEGIEKCHWVQSGERAASQNRQKRYTKRANSDNRAPSEQSLNGSQSNSVVSSNADDDSKIDDLTFDEDSKESANSFSNVVAPTRPKKQPTPKRPKISNKSADSAPSATVSNQPPIIPPMDYNRIAINNLMKERNDSLERQTSSGISNSLMNQATAAAAAAANMPSWLQANQFAMAAAILGGLPFPAAAGNMMQNFNGNNNAVTNNHMQAPSTINAPNNSGLAINMATSKPMDLSLEHSSPKPISTQPNNRSRSKQKN